MYLFLLLFSLLVVVIVGLHVRGACDIGNDETEAETVLL